MMYVRLSPGSSVHALIQAPTLDGLGMSSAVSTAIWQLFVALLLNVV